MNAELQTSHPKGKLGMSDASSLSRISALSFHFTLLSPLLFFCLRPLLFLSSLLFFFSFFFLFLLFFFCLMAHFHGFIVPENSSIFSIESQALRYGTCVAGRRWQSVHGVYTGICHYAFMSSEKKSCSVHSCFVKCLIWCRWFRWKSTISASPSIMCFFFFFFFLTGKISDRRFLRKFVFDVCMLYFIFVSRLILWISKKFFVSWLLCRISRGCIDVHFQFWCIPLWLTGLKTPTN